MYYVHMAFFIYIAKCADGTLYTGSCKDLKKREIVHNEGKGAKYTRGRLPVEFVYTEKHADRSEALKREAEIKKLSREAKLKLL